MQNFVVPTLLRIINVITACKFIPSEGQLSRVEVAVTIPF